MENSKRIAGQKYFHHYKRQKRSDAIEAFKNMSLIMAKMSYDANDLANDVGDETRFKGQAAPEITETFISNTQSAIGNLQALMNKVIQLRNLNII